MSAYTGPIVKNGLIMPLLFLAVLLGVGAYGLLKIQGISEAREQVYKTHLERLKSTSIFENKLKPGRPRQKQLEDLLKAEIKPALAKQLSESMSRYKDKEYELQQISVKQTDDRGSIGSTIQSGLSKVQMVFRGGYGPMQETLLDIESQFPQLQMEKMTVGITKGFGLDQREALTFNVDYIAWKW